MNSRAAGVTVETASKELLREVKRHGTSDETAGTNVEDHSCRGSTTACTLRRRAGVQARGYLRGRIRIVHAVHVFHLRG